MTPEQQEVYADLCKQYSEEAVDAYISILGENYLQDALDDFTEAYVGEYRSDEDFAQSLAEELGEMPKDNRWPHYCIDWEYAARELMHDYSEENGHYFENI